MDWSTYWASFSRGPWFAMLMTMLACGIVNAILNMTLKAYAMPVKDIHYSNMSFSFLFMVNGTLLQGTPYEPHRMSRRIVFISLFMYGVTLWGSYNAMLTSILASKIHNPPFRDLVEMLYRTEYNIITPASSSHVARFKVILYCYFKTE